MSRPAARRQAHSSGWSLLTGVALLGAQHALRRAQTSSHALRRAQTSSRSDRDGSRDGRGTRDLGATARGRSADKPADIPATGWKDVLKRVYGRLGEDRILVIAAGITFYGLLALFPALAALVSLYGMVADPSTIAKTLNNLGSVLPGGALDVVRGQIETLTSHGAGTLGVATLIGLAVSLWSANSGMKALFDGLNVAYREHEKRSFISLNATSLCFTICMLVSQ